MVRVTSLTWQTREFFSSLDIDRNGYIEKKEMKKIMDVSDRARVLRHCISPSCFPRPSTIFSAKRSEARIRLTTRWIRSSRKWMWTATRSCPKTNSSVVVCRTITFENYWRLPPHKCAEREIPCRTLAISHRTKPFERTSSSSSSSSFLIRFFFHVFIWFTPTYQHKQEDDTQSIW